MEELKVVLTKNKKEKKLKNIGFGSVYTDHMLVVDYDEERGWHNPQILPYAPLELDPAAMCLHYAQTVFEGLKAYKTQKGEVLLFRPQDNFKRLNESCERLCIPKLDETFCLESLKKLVELEKDWIPTEENASLYIRPFIISTEAKLGVAPSRNYKYVVILSPSGPYYASGLNPVDIYVETNYVRAVKGGMGMAKTGGNYACSLKSQEEAHGKNFSQTLWLDGVERKYVEEVGAMNIFFVFENEIVTPAINGSILSGITRKTVIQLLKDKGHNVVERKISIDEISDAYDNGALKEIFGTGTAAVVSPVGCLVWKEKSMVLNDRKTGDISMSIYKELTDIQLGKKEDKYNWVVKVSD